MEKKQPLDAQSVKNSDDTQEKDDNRANIKAVWNDYNAPNLPARNNSILSRISAGVFITNGP